MPVLPIFFRALSSLLLAFLNAFCSSVSLAYLPRAFRRLFSNESRTEGPTKCFCIVFIWAWQIKNNKNEFDVTTFRINFGIFSLDTTTTNIWARVHDIPKRGTIVHDSGVTNKWDNMKPEPSGNQSPGVKDRKIVGRSGMCWESPRVIYTINIKVEKLIFSPRLDSP